METQRGCDVPTFYSETDKQDLSTQWFVGAVHQCMNLDIRHDSLSLTLFTSRKGQSMMAAERNGLTCLCVFPHLWVTQRPFSCRTGVLRTEQYAAGICGVTQTFQHDCLGEFFLPWCGWNWWHCWDTEAGNKYLSCRAVTQLKFKTHQQLKKKTLILLCHRLKPRRQWNPPVGETLCHVGTVELFTWPCVCI